MIWSSSRQTWGCWKAWAWGNKLVCHVIFKIQLVQLGNILHLFNIQITAHLFHGRLHLNIRICCNYPEISSGRLLLNNCWNSWSLYYSLLGPSSVWSESSSSRTKKFEYESSIEYSQGPGLEAFVNAPTNLWHLNIHLFSSQKENNSRWPTSLWPRNMWKPGKPR